MVVVEGPCLEGDEKTAAVVWPAAAAAAVVVAASPVGHSTAPKLHVSAPH